MGAVDSDKPPLVKHHTQLQKYYASLESRLGYRLFLGGTRHFGYYSSEKSLPWPITKALRRMEDHLFDSLSLTPGPETEVLDAGCGYGYVAMHLAKRGLNIQGIDIVDRHVTRARENIKAHGLADKVQVRRGDYTDLTCFHDSRFSGVYTMETLVHAAEPEKVLSGFFRVLKPGGSLALYEYDHASVDSLEKGDKEAMKVINNLSAMPANQKFEFGVLEKLLQDAGFQDIEMRDISKNVLPLLWLFFVVAYVPFLVIRALGLEKHFVNAMSAVEGYRSAQRGVYRYTVFTARKPTTTSRKSVK